MTETIMHDGNHYPLFQAQGNASQFAIPFAKHLCKGEGLDIGCMKKEWSFPGIKRPQLVQVLYTD